MRWRVWSALRNRSAAISSLASTVRTVWTVDRGLLPRANCVRTPGDFQPQRWSASTYFLAFHNAAQRYQYMINSPGRTGFTCHTPPRRLQPLT